MTDTVTVPSPFVDLLEQRKASEAWQRVNQLERQMADLPQTFAPANNLFTPVEGHPDLFLYSREITMPAGMLLTTLIHRFEHPYIISKGSLAVWDDALGWQRFHAPYRGVTHPGTRRILYIYEETTWTTFHVTKSNDPDLVVDELTASPFEFGHLSDLSKTQREILEANAHQSNPFSVPCPFLP